MHTNKKLQSAIELLSTYSFMIAIVSVIIIALVYFALPASVILPSQCSSFGTLHCSGVEYYINSAGNSNVFIYLSNAGSSPANVLATNIIVKGNTLTGACTTDLTNPANTIVNPGANTICFATAAYAPSVGKQLAGQFNITLTSCNSGVSQFSPQNCSFIPIKLSGSFIVYPSPAPSAPIALQCYNLVLSSSPSKAGTTSATLLTGSTCQGESAIGYTSGSTVSISAAPAQLHQHFVTWTGAGGTGQYTGTSNPYTITMGW